MDPFYADDRLPDAGDIRLVKGTIGATFRVTIPDRAIELKTRRGERARAGSRRNSPGDRGLILTGRFDRYPRAAKDTP